MTPQANAITREQDNIIFQDTTTSPLSLSTTLTYDGRHRYNKEAEIKNITNILNIAILVGSLVFIIYIGIYFLS